MSFLMALGKRAFTRAQCLQPSCDGSGDAVIANPFALSLITILSRIFSSPKAGNLLSSQNCASVDHWNSECSVNHTVATGISIPDVGNQRLN